MRSASQQAKFRREVFLAHKKVDPTGRIYLVCHICKGKIDPAVEGWEASHTIPHAWGGQAGRPAHIACHRKQTSEKDVPAIAKAKRVSDKHYGIKRKGWGSRYRKKVDGTVISKGD